MYGTAAKLHKLYFYTRSIRSSDQTYAGGTFSSTAGMAKVCSNAQPHRKWLQLEWPPQWSTVHIMSKELLPIVLSCVVKGPLLARHKVPFQCDNSGVVAALQKDSARDSTVMHLLRCLWFFVAHYNIVLMSEHIAGVDNCTADHLSRHNMHSFFSINPQASPIPTPVSPLLLQLLTPLGPDWTLATFKQLSLSTIKDA